MKAVSDEKKSGKKSAVKKTAASSGADKNTVKKAVSASTEGKKTVAGKTVKKTAVKTVKAPAKAEKAPAKAVKKTVAKVEKVPAKAVKKTVAKVEKAPAKETVAAKKDAAAKAAAAKRPELHIKKVKLSKADKKFFHDLLIRERAKFGQLLKFHADEALTSRKDSGAGRAAMATHMADLGSDNFRHDFELGLLSGEADVMEMIDEALQKLEDSEYGVCLDCGQMIPRARLEAKPYARYCTKCKSLRESTEDGFRRR